MEDTDYRNWVVLFDQANAEADQAAGMAAALARFDPQVILVDPNLREYLDHAATDDPKPAATWAWMARAGFRRVATVRDPTYGLMEIYKRATP